MSEIARLRMDLQARKFEKMDIEARASGKLRSLKEALAGAAIRSLGEINFPLIADLAVELNLLREKWDQLVKDIGTIETELRG